MSLVRAMKHFMIAAAAGDFMKWVATKDDFEKALRAHKEATDE